MWLQLKVLPKVGVFRLAKGDGSGDSGGGSAVGIDNDCDDAGDCIDDRACLWRY